MPPPLKIYVNPLHPVQKPIVHSHIDYYLIIYSAARKTNLPKIDVAVRTILKIILRSMFFSPQRHDLRRHSQPAHNRNKGLVMHKVSHQSQSKPLKPYVQVFENSLRLHRNMASKMLSQSQNSFHHKKKDQAL